MTTLTSISVSSLGNKLRLLPLLSLNKMPVQVHNPSSTDEESEEDEEPEIEFIIKDYKFKDSDIIGEGTFGSVYRGTNRKTGELVAGKRFKNMVKNSTLPKDLTIELIILATYPHKNILQLKENGFHRDKSDGKFWMITHYCNYGDLTAFLQKEKPPDLTKEAIISGIISGMVHLHKHHVSHRDMKPPNILIDLLKNGKFVAKIADFGLSRIHDGSMSTANVGTLRYMAPEVSYSVAIGKKYDGKMADIFSCGLVLVDIIFAGEHRRVGQFLGAKENPGQVLNGLRSSMTAQASVVHQMVHVHEVCSMFELKIQQLASSMLSPDSTQRPTMIRVQEDFKSGMLDLPCFVRINGVLAVGFRHYGGPLTVGSNYQLVPEPGNAYDPNAIRLIDAAGTVAHVKATQARHLQPLFTSMLGPAMVTVLTTDSFLDYTVGRVQRCRMMFRIQRANRRHVAQALNNVTELTTSFVNL